MPDVHWSTFFIGSKGNIALGDGAEAATTVGEQNIAIGENALNKNISGNFNVAIGDEALKETISGVANVAIGRQAQRLNTLGANNIAIGEEALKENGISGGNVAVGAGALNKTGQTGTEQNGNTVVGSGAVENMEEGTENTAVGRNISMGNKSSNNVVIGAKAEVGEKSTGTIAIGGGHSGEQKEKLYIHNKNTLTPLIGGTFTAGSEEAVINGKLKAEGLTTAKGGLTVEGALTLGAEAAGTVVKEVEEKLKELKEATVTTKVLNTTNIKAAKKITAEEGVEITAGALVAKTIEGLELLKVLGNPGTIELRRQILSKAAATEPAKGTFAVTEAENAFLVIKPSEEGAELTRVQFLLGTPKEAETLILFNNSAFKLTVVNETAEAGTGKFAMLSGGNLILEPKAIKIFQYISSRWRNVDAFLAGEGLTLTGQTFAVKAEGVTEGMLAAGAKRQLLTTTTAPEAIKELTEAESVTGIEPSATKAAMVWVAIKPKVTTETNWKVEANTVVVGQYKGKPSEAGAVTPIGTFYVLPGKKIKLTKTTAEIEKGLFSVQLMN